VGYSVSSRFNHLGAMEGRAENGDIGQLEKFLKNVKGMEEL